MSGRDAFIRATGVVGPTGVGTAALCAALEDARWTAEAGLERPDGPPLPVATCRDFTTQGHLPPLVARRLDRPARLLVVAAREALAGAGDETRFAPERTGVTAGTWNAGTGALVEVLTAVFLASPGEASPLQFPSTVANAPASQLGLLERFAGPNVTFFEKQVGGLRAASEARRLLARRRAEAILACGVDEAHWLNAEGYARLGVLRGPGGDGMLLAEGATVLLMTAAPGPGVLARLAGAGSASSPGPPWRYPDGPGALVAAARQALRDAGLAPRDVGLVVGLANGVPAAERLELAALPLLLEDHRPAVTTPAVRLGEGAFSAAARLAVAALTVGGRVLPRWEAPAPYRRAGYAPPSARPAHALIWALAGGGSAHAVVLSAP